MRCTNISPAGRGTRSVWLTTKGRTTGSAFGLGYSQMCVRFRRLLFDKELPSPILLAPAVYQKTMVCWAKLRMLAERPGCVPFVVSTNFRIAAIEELVKETTGPLWFQLYVQNNREITTELIRRVEGAGCNGPGSYRRYPGFESEDLSISRRVPVTPWQVHTAQCKRGAKGTWILLAIVCSLGGYRLAAPDRARQTMAERDLTPSGCRPSSQPRGRHSASFKSWCAYLDTMPATIDVLPTICEKVAGRVPIIVDGGIRRGTDVVKALMRGASAVMIGRPLSLRTRSRRRRCGCSRIDLLTKELAYVLALVGKFPVKEVGSGLSASGGVVGARI